jgi:hypothetical protein
MGRDPEAKEHGTSGRGSLSFLVARPNGGLPSEVQAAATRAIRGILDSAYEEAMETLIAHLATLRRIAAYLVEHERVDGETFEALFDGRIDVAAPEGEWRPETARPRDWGDIVPFRELRGRGPIAVPAPVVSEAPTPIPLPVPAAVAVEAPSAGELIDEPGATGAAVIAAQPGEPLTDSIAATSASVIEDGAWAAPPLAADPLPVSPGTGPRTARRVKTASKVARALGGPTSRRVRRLAAGLLASAEARVRPGEPEPER